MQEMKSRIVLLTLAALAALLQTPNTRAQATNPPHLREFPSVERVLREIKGTDPVDTAARQSVIFNSLRMIILQLVGASKRLGERPDTTRTPNEDRLMKTYLEAWHRLMDVPSSPTERERYDKLVASYIGAPEFSTDEILRRLFSPEFRASYNRVMRKQPPQQPAPAQSSAEAPPAVKFGEYATPDLSVNKALLDSLTYELKVDPDALAYIISYGGRTSRPGDAQKAADNATDYLKNMGGINYARLHSIDGGYRKQLTVELWIVPGGATPPVATPTVDPKDVKPTRRPAAKPRTPPKGKKT
jgi:hypothetical protein